MKGDCDNSKGIKTTDKAIMNKVIDGVVDGVLWFTWQTTRVIIIDSCTTMFLTLRVLD